MFDTLKRGMLFLTCLGLTGAAAEAQPAPDKKWQVEFHAGAGFGGDTPGGTPIGLFPAGTPIQTGFGSATSRAVSSWYFGDGAQLLNQTNTALGVGARITPLDPALTESLARREGRGTFGLRVSRDLTRRLGAEFSVDYGRTALRLTDGARTAIEAARSSFTSAWNALLATGVTTDRSVNSTSEIGTGSGEEISVSGALKVIVASWGRLVPYVIAGGGAVFQRGDMPAATLVGTYGFRFVGVLPFNERDTVTLRVEQKDRLASGILGGGLEYNLSSSSGLRGDVRLRFSGHDVNTVVSATPSVTLQTPVFAITTGTLPGIQFSNNTLFNRPSSLSGPTVSDLRTFTGSGVRAVTNVTVGFFLRF